MNTPMTVPDPDLVRPEPLDRPLVTFRVTLRGTDAVLRRTANIDEPSFGMPKHYADQIMEFVSETAANEAIRYIRFRTDMGRKHFRPGQLEVRAEVHAGLSREGENNLLCKIRDTAIHAAWMESRDLLTNARRGMVGIERRGA